MKSNTIQRGAIFGYVDGYERSKVQLILADYWTKRQEL